MLAVMRTAMCTVAAFCIACGSETGSIDASIASDARFPCRVADGGHHVGYLPEGRMCTTCPDGELGNTACRAEYGEPDGCTTYCESAAVCARYCEGDCRYLAAAETCETSEDCLLNGQPAICDPLCGTPGGCRFCFRDSECEALLGAEGFCNQACGVCCTGLGGSHPCQPC